MRSRSNRSNPHDGRSPEGRSPPLTRGIAIKVHEATSPEIVSSKLVALGKTGNEMPAAPHG